MTATPDQRRARMTALCGGLILLLAGAAPCCCPKSRPRAVRWWSANQSARLGVARLALDLDHRVLGRQLGEDALVVDLDDVDPALVEAGGDRGERARLVLRPDPQPRDAAAADQLADQHVGEQVRVDVAAAQHVPTLRPRSAPARGQQRARPAAPAPFDHRLLDRRPAARPHARGRARRPARCGRRCSLMMRGSAPGSLTAMPSASVSPPIAPLPPSTTFFIDG
jgi:hypothetical protein